MRINKKLILNSIAWPGAIILLLFSFSEESFSNEFICKLSGERPVLTMHFNKTNSIAVCGYPYETTNNGIVRLSAAESSVFDTSTGKEYIWTDWNESLGILKSEKKLIIYFYRSLPTYNTKIETEQLIYTYSFELNNNQLVFSKVFSYKAPNIKKIEIEEILNNFNEVVSKKEFNKYGETLPMQLMVAALNGSTPAEELLNNFGKYVPLDGEISHAYSQAYDLYKKTLENDNRKMGPESN